VLGEQLKLRHLRLLEIVFRTGSLTAAALELHLTQPAVTNMLKELEAVLDARLVDRDRRGCRLTAAGMLTLDRFRASLRHFDAALETLHTKAAPLLRVAMLPLFAAELLPRTITHLRDAGVHLRLQIVEDHVNGVVRRVTEGLVDCGLSWIDSRAIVDSAPRQLLAIPLRDEALHVVCAATNPAARKRTVDLRFLARQEWILAPRTTSTRQAFDALFFEAGMEPPLATIESASLHTNLSLASATQMFTFAPASGIATAERLGQLRRLHVTHCSGFTARLGLLVSSETAPYAPMKAFADALSQVSARAEYPGRR
jgi:DNA-binding transcriptional LysR family regulator